MKAVPHITLLSLEMCDDIFSLSFHLLLVKNVDQLKGGQYTDNLHLLVYNSDFHFCPSR